MNLIVFQIANSERRVAINPENVTSVVQVVGHEATIIFAEQEYRVAGAFDAVTAALTGGHTKAFG